MLGFEKVDETEAKRVIRCYGKVKSEYADVAFDFLDSGVEVAKLTGFSETDAIKTYGCLSSLAHGTLKEDGFRVSKRGSVIYLLNVNINPVADAPEKR